MISDSNTSLKNNDGERVGLISPLEPDKVLTTPPQSGSHLQSAFRLWTHRLAVLLFVFLCATLGVLLVILPWHSEWTDNRLLLAHPDLRSFMAHGFVRGLCSGLGLIDIWIGFWEAIHYHEDPRP